jgi:hypothetical protein
VVHYYGQLLLQPLQGKALARMLQLPLLLLLAAERAVVLWQQCESRSCPVHAQRCYSCCCCC